MKNTYTPGPWEIDESQLFQNLTTKGWHVNIDDSNNRIVAGINADTLDQLKANAGLIAAAPETATERDRLKEINKELVQALEKARKVITMAATEVQRPEILPYLSGNYKGNGRGCLF